MSVEEMRRRARERGQGMTEYIIIVAVVAILSIAVVTAFGDQIRAMFVEAGTELSTEGDGSIDIENQMDDSMVNQSLNGGGGGGEGGGF